MTQVQVGVFENSNHLQANNEQYLKMLDETFQVVEGDREFSSRLITKKSFKAGSVVCNIEGHTESNVPRYSTVQVGLNSHIELNSILVYMNVIFLLLLLLLMLDSILTFFFSILVLLQLKLMYLL